MQDQTWTPPAKKNTRAAIAGALAAVALASAGITAGVMAATRGDSSASAAGPAPGGGGRGGGGLNALHGEYVVSDGNGGYTTQLTQTGTVSAITDTSITVESTDGFTQTYVIGSTTTKSDVAADDDVRVTATTSGDEATATAITDASAQQGGMPDGGQGAPPDQQRGATNS